MGIEYKIGYRPRTPEALDRLLRRAPFFTRVEPKYQGYEFRASCNQNTTAMPDACANIHEGSIIFVDNGNRLLAEDVLAFIKSDRSEAGEFFDLEEL